MNLKKENYQRAIASKKQKSLEAKKVFILIGCGALIGFLNGFFGGGGGMVCVPLLERVLKLSSKQAHATAIFVIFPLSFLSSCIYVFSNSVASLPLLTVALGSVLGGLLGAYILKFMPPKALRLVFALIMMAGGVRMIL